MGHFTLWKVSYYNHLQFVMIADTEHLTIMTFSAAVRLVEDRALEGNPTALQMYVVDTVYNQLDIYILIMIYIFSGLGIGVSAASLQNANITLDIVELDPTVYDYAIDYFKLEKKHNIYIQDGRRFIENAPSRKYNYVLHDVFTGGSVPSSLFSTKALEQIKRIMKDDGVLALVCERVLVYITIIIDLIS